MKKLLITLLLPLVLTTSTPAVAGQVYTGTSSVTVEKHQPGRLVPDRERITTRCSTYVTKRGATTSCSTTSRPAPGGAAPSAPTSVAELLKQVREQRQPLDPNWDPYASTK
jgi:hypothetical protein